MSTNESEKSLDFGAFGQASVTKIETNEVHGSFGETDEKQKH